MISIFRGARPAEICTEIRMLRQKHKGTFVLLEGAGDWKRLEKFLDPNTTLAIPCHGKNNVLETIDIVQDRGFEDCLGLVDADFDRINNLSIENDDIIFSNFHDFDMDLMSTEATTEYCHKYGTKQIIENNGGMKTIIDSIITELKPLSSLRYANEKKKLEYSLSDIEIESFFDGHTIDVDAMIDAVSFGKFDTHECRSALKGHIVQYVDAELELWQLTNGHDLAAALGIALRARIGNRTEFQTQKKQMEADFRSAFDWPHLHASGLAAKISSWQTSRGHAAILRADT